jgi:plasmid replication initiation protein
MNNINILEHNKLKKHVFMIHCSNNLSLLQRKISNVLLFHAYPFLESQEEHRIAISELCRYLKYRGYNYDAIKQALKSLISTVIEWNIFGDDTHDEDWTASSILASVNIKNSVCTYAYSPRMKQLLYSPTMYGKIDLAIQSLFTSNYGLALYENCSRYRKLNKTKLFSIDQFRKIMGVSNEKYLIFRDFKKRVIDKAIEEINNLSDISVEANFVRAGQKITGLYFLIAEKKGRNNLISSCNDIGRDIKNNSESKEKGTLQLQKNSLTEKLKKTFYLSEQKIDELVQKYGVDKIEDKIKQIESAQSFINGTISNMAGFLIDALKKDYMPIKSAKVVCDEKRVAKEKKDCEVRILNLNQDKILANYNKYLDNQLDIFVNGADKEYLDKLLIKFELFLENKKHGMVLDKFKKHRLHNKVVKVYFRLFLQEGASDVSANFISLEQYTNEC